MQNPFTTTFSKMPDQTYILTEEPAEIIDNFSYEKPAESVYKITGVRGSGKTVTLAKVEEAYTSEENRKAGWLVYRLSPSRDLLRQFAAMLYKEDFIKKNEQSRSISVNASVFGTGGEFGVSKTSRNEMFDIGVEIEAMILAARDNGKKILIGIDEISKNEDMIAFASEFGKWLRADYPVYMVCTGLYENIHELSNVKNLTFFRRASTIKTRPLNVVRMSEMYRTKLSISGNEARNMAEMTKGYAYAFQMLGILCFRRRENETMEDILAAFRTELFAYSYEKIWEELSREDRRLVRLLTDKDEYKREELLTGLGEKAGSYSVYRDRLLKRGVITARQGYISLALPCFGEYVKEYGQE
ncbi:MAG: hypothetical protein IJ860_02795 [Eubacterium sp.]|nr:hypothetical protein [Eubacterium sp.]